MMREEAVCLFPYPDGKRRDGSIKFSQGLGHSGPSLTADSPPITVDEAFKLFAEDLIPREISVTRWFKMPPQQHEFDAIIAGYYQAGSKMKVVVDLINKGEVGEAMALFLTFNRDRGMFSLGLAGRRQREVRRFLKADYSDEVKQIPRLKLFRDAHRVDVDEIDFPPQEAIAA